MGPFAFSVFSCWFCRHATPKNFENKMFRNAISGHFVDTFVKTFSSLQSVFTCYNLCINMLHFCQEYCVETLASYNVIFVNAILWFQEILNRVQFAGRLTPHRAMATKIQNLICISCWRYKLL